MASLGIKKIFCIDDDPDMLAMFVMLLECLEEKAEVHCFQDAKSALAEMEHTKPDLVLLDIIMPEMNGIIAYKKILDNPNLHNVRVVFVTGRKSEDDLKQYAAMHVPVITKPVDAQSFLETVHRYLYNKYDRLALV